ncbi:MAG: molybdopterin-dependent oxidoreductase [Chloroflexota bacterium]
MTAAALDRLLAVLVAALAVTGLVSLRMGAAADAWLFAVHGVLAAALAVTVGWKVARSLPKAVAARRWRRVVLGSTLSLATCAALVGGFAWVAGGRLLTIGAWTVLTVHAWLGLFLIPLAVVHLLPRRWRLLVPRPRQPAARPRGPIVSRRRLLVGASIGAASIVLFGASELADRMSGGIRRFTGSRWLPAGGVPPSTTFLGEGAPDIDPLAWRLRVRGPERESTLSLAELVALGTVDRSAVLDCTSGWALETTWGGVPLRAVLAATGGPSDRRVTVRSATGWATSLAPEEVDRALLAVEVAGVALPVANGAPCRLVVADHRGLDWVKWVVEVETA